MEKLYEGKSKIVYEGEEAGTCVIRYKDTATAGNGVKKEDLPGKGKLNAEISNIIFQYLAKNGVKTHLIRVPLPDGPTSIEVIDRRFSEAYWERFRVRLPEIRASVVTVSTTVIGVLPRADLAGLLPRSGRASEASDAQAGTRQMRFSGNLVDAPVYDRARLPTGARIAGPAVLTQLDTTTVLEPGDVAEVDQHDNLIVDKGSLTDR